jgi:hypothetical protein
MSNEHEKKGTATVGVTKVFSQDDASFKAEIYDDVSDTEPSAIVEVNRLSNIFSETEETT